MERTEDEIDLQLERAAGVDRTASRHPRQSFEQGVDATIRWLLGWTEDPPLDDA